MMSLRLAEGCDMDRYAALSGSELNGNAVSGLEDIGMVSSARGRLIASPAGRMVLNAVLRELIVV